jgi:NADH:flavin oxidoreductase / NADH oxidase family
MTSALFSPIRLGDLELANRIVVSPMCQYSADDDVATDWHGTHLGMLASSGATLLVIEAPGLSVAAVSPMVASASIPTTARRCSRASSTIAGATALPSSASNLLMPDAKRAVVADGLRVDPSETEASISSCTCEAVFTPYPGVS